MLNTKFEGRRKGENIFFSDIFQSDLYLVLRENEESHVVSDQVSAWGVVQRVRTPFNHMEIVGERGMLKRLEGA